MDANGNSRPQAIMPYRINGQYIMEGLVASFLFTLGGECCPVHVPRGHVGVGFMLLDAAASPQQTKNSRLMTSGMGFVCILIAFFVTRVFMRIKLPGYMLN